MKNSSVFPLLVVLISAGFVIISFLVYLTGGKSKSLIAKKLRIGAMLIGMTAILNGCRVPVVSCYKPAPVPVITSVKPVNSEGEIVVDPKATMLSFECSGIYQDTICYKLIERKKLIKEGNIVVSKTEINEGFLIDLGPELAPGTYVLNIYYGKIAEFSENSSTIGTFEIEANKR